MSTTKKTTNKELLAYLKSLDFQSGFVDRLKVYYRPLVCPFADLINLVSESDKVGDIGCGSGQFCLLLAGFAKPVSVYGIEINERLVQNARQLFEKHSSVPYIFEEFDGIHFPDAISDLDILFLNDVIHHVPKPIQEQFISGLIQKMKPGAKLIVKDIDGSSPLVYCNKMHDLVFAGEIGNELPFSRTIALLEKNGLSIVESSKKRMYVYPHYTIVARKQ